MFFTFPDLVFLAEVIEYANDQDNACCSVEQDFEGKAVIDLQEIFHAEACYKKIHACPQKREQGRLIGHYRALQGKLLAKNEVFVNVAFGFLAHRISFGVQNVWKPAANSPFRN